MSTEPFVAKFNDSLVFTPEDLEPLDTFKIDEYGHSPGKCNVRGLSAQQLVLTKFGSIFKTIDKPKNRFFSMDLYDPILQVRVEIKYEKTYRSASADLKFIRDILLNPGESMYIYINLGCMDMPTIKYYRDNIFLINGRRLTWDMLYNIHMSALDRLNHSVDSAYALLDAYRDAENQRKIDDAIRIYLRNHLSDEHKKLNEQLSSFQSLFEQMKEIDNHTQPIDMIATFSTVQPEEDELDIPAIEWDEDDSDVEQPNTIQTTTAVIESSDVRAISDSQSYVLSYDDILTAMLNDTDKRSDIETERDVVTYLTEVPYIQKLLCTIGCLPAYFFNRFVEICNHKNIRVTHAQKSINALFPSNVLDKQRRQYKLEGNRKIRTSIRTFVYTPATRASIVGNPKLKRFDLNGQETDLSIFINSTEYTEAMRSTKASDQDLSLIEALPATSFVHISKPSGNAITAMKSEETYPLMFRIAKSFADYVNEYGTTGREYAYFRIADDNGVISDYNVMRVLDSIRDSNETLYRRINAEWFNERLYDADIKRTNRCVMKWINWCIEHRINFTKFTAILGANGPSDLHTILAILVNNQRKNSKNNPEYAKNRTTAEKEELNTFVKSKLRDIEKYQLDLKKNTNGNYTSCISAAKR